MKKKFMGPPVWSRERVSEVENKVVFKNSMGERARFIIRLKVLQLKKKIRDGTTVRGVDYPSPKIRGLIITWIRINIPASGKRLGKGDKCRAVGSFFELGCLTGIA